MEYLVIGILIMLIVGVIILDRIHEALQEANKLQKAHNKAMLDADATHWRAIHKTWNAKEEP